MTYKTIPVDSHSKMLAATKLRKLRALPILCPPRKVHMNQTTRYVRLGPLKYLGLKIIFEQHCFGRRALACPTLHNPPTFLSGYNESCPTGPEPRLGKPKRLFKSLQVPANWESWSLWLYIAFCFPLIIVVIKMPWMGQFFLKEFRLCDSISQWQSLEKWKFQWGNSIISRACQTQK